MGDQEFSEEDWDVVNDLIGSKEYPNAINFFSLLKALQNSPKTTVGDIAVEIRNAETDIPIIREDDLIVNGVDIQQSKSLDLDAVKERPEFKDVSAGIIEQLKAFLGDEEFARLAGLSATPASSGASPIEERMIELQEKKLAALRTSASRNISSKYASLINRKEIIHL